MSRDMKNGPNGTLGNLMLVSAGSSARRVDFDRGLEEGKRVSCFGIKYFNRESSNVLLCLKGLYM